MAAATTDWTLERIRAHILAGLPLVRRFGLELVEAGPQSSSVRITDNPEVVRPGGSVAGPVRFAAADVATYAIVLAGRHDPDAATVDLALKFLRPALDLPLLAQAEVLRAGRRLIMTEIRIAPESDPSRLVAHATATWAFST